MPLTAVTFDHSTIMRKVISSLLTQMGYEVVEALTKKQCFEVVRDNMPDVIFVDGILPSAEISDLITEIRALPEGDKSRIIITPLEHDLGKITRAMRAGGNNFLMRPFSQENLKEKLLSVGLSA